MHDLEVSTPKHFNDPETGRPITQLTSGHYFDYPLYYFIPTATRDGRSIVFYRHRGDDIQLYRLDVESGHTVRLTNASTRNAPVALAGLDARGGVEAESTRGEAQQPAPNAFVRIDKAAVYALSGTFTGGHRAPNRSRRQGGKKRFILPSLSPEIKDHRVIPCLLSDGVFCIAASGPSQTGCRVVHLFQSKRCGRQNSVA